VWRGHSCPRNLLIMKKLLQAVSGLGCLASVIAPVIAIIIYPRANWLFAFPLLGIALIVINVVTHKQLTPIQVAERAENLLNGTFGGWDVDNYEHLNPKNEQLKDLWIRTMSIGGLPETWVGLDDGAKGRMREVIAEMKRLPAQNS
jgi:hypothetical protein